MTLFNKKTLVASTLVLTVLCGGLFVGCSNNNEQSSNNEVAVKNVDLNALSSNLEQSNLFTVKCMTVPAKDFPAFLEIGDLIEEGFAITALMNVHFENVAVVKTQDPDAVVEAINTYLKSDSVRSFGDGYGREENITAVQNAKVAAIGNYVYFIATPNSDDIEKVVLDTLK